MKIQTNIELLEQGFLIKGDLAFSTVSALIDQGKEQIEKVDADTVQINLDSVKRIDSAGIALLLAWKRDCLSKKKSCQFQGASKQAMSLLDTYQLKDILL